MRAATRTRGVVRRNQPGAVRGLPSGAGGSAISPRAGAAVAFTSAAAGPTVSFQIDVMLLDPRFDLKGQTRLVGIAVLFREHFSALGLERLIHLLGISGIADLGNPIGIHARTRLNGDFGHTYQHLLDTLVPL